MWQNWRLLALPASRLGSGQRNARSKSKGKGCERPNLGRRVSCPHGREGRGGPRWAAERLLRMGSCSNSRCQPHRSWAVTGCVAAWNCFPIHLRKRVILTYILMYTHRYIHVCPPSTYIHGFARHTMSEVRMHVINTWIYLQSRYDITTSRICD